MRLTNLILKRGCLMLALLAVSALHAESVYIVTITDIGKNDTQEVLTREALTTLKNRIKDETRIFPKALAAAQKEWAENDMTKRDKFPTSGFAPRKIKEEGPINEEMARKKVEKRAEREMNRDFEKAAAKKGGGKTKPSERELEKQARAAQKDAIGVAAAELIQKQIDKLLQETPQ